MKDYLRVGYILSGDKFKVNHPVNILMRSATAENYNVGR
jgi:hypothetical protein